MTTLTVAERIAQIKKDRAAGITNTSTNKAQGFWLEHTIDAIKRKSSDMLDSHDVRKEEASVLRQALRDQRIADGCRW